MLVYKVTSPSGRAWNSYRQCGRDLAICSTSIGKCLRKQKGFLSVQGYIFEYKEGGQF